MGDSIAVATLRQLLFDHQHFHTELQMDSFITAKSGLGDPYGMYVQALRELSARHASLHEHYTKLSELKLDLEEENVRAPFLNFTMKQKLKIKRSELRIKDLEFKIRAMEKVGEDREREFMHFYRQAAALKQQIGTLDPMKRARLDREFWAKKLRARMAVQLLQQGRVSADIIEILPSLPEEIRAKVWGYLDDPQSTLQWYKGLASGCPEVQSLGAGKVDVKALVCSSSPQV